MIYLFVVTILFLCKYCWTLNNKFKTIYKCITEHDLRMKNGFCRGTWRRGKKCERNTNKRVGDTKWGCLVQLCRAIWCVQLNQIVYRAQVSPTFKRIPKLCNMILKSKQRPRSELYRKYNSVILFLVVEYRVNIIPKYVWKKILSSPYWIIVMFLTKLL